MEATLPDYKNPPVVEVAMGAQFKPLDDLRAAHVGLYWSHVKSDFPDIDEKPPLPHTAQNLDDLISPKQLRLGLSNRPELPRTWFISASGAMLLQLQRDRFVINWRKRPDDDQYPRFPAVKETFMRQWKDFVSFLASNEIGVPTLDLLELTYVNTVPQGNGWDDMATIGNVFLPAAWSSRSEFLRPPESMNTSMVFLLPKRDGTLSVDMGPVAAEGKPRSLRISLSVTGLPKNTAAMEGFDSWFDRAREAVVRGFSDLTSPSTDELWGRKS
jgi:uncharacterized protein (TIGR04255 family)